MHEAKQKIQTTAEFLFQKKSHNYFVHRERLEYFRKKELAIVQPREYLSIAIDGAENQAFTFPHFLTSTKDQRGNGLKLHLIGV